MTIRTSIFLFVCSATNFSLQIIHFYATDIKAFILEYSLIVSDMTRSKNMVADGHADHHFDHNEVALFGNCNFI